ncbi:MAG: L,D-transpeptidase, partial [Hyphomicrobiaceae bacterium]|nr:L,D-transpeptidase [Hyphomicrobiaceae bacterium]
GAGSMVVDTRARKLYYVISTGSAYRYPISVGRAGYKWYGTQKVSRVESWPSWTPTPLMRKRQPYLPVTMRGGVRNPLGAKAIYLGSTYYRIHGTNQPRSIGRAASSGCFRMMNKHVLHLATLVQIGATVHVVRSWKGRTANSDQAPAPKDKKS